MSAQSDKLERDTGKLGDIGELEGDADMSEWASLISKGNDKKPGKSHHRNQQQSTKVSSVKEITDKVGSKSAVEDAEKSKGVKENKSNSDKNTEKVTKPASSSSSHNAIQNKNSQSLSNIGNITVEPSKSSTVQTSSDVGDIAGVIGILDSSRKKITDISKIRGSTDDKKSDNGVKTPLKSAELSAAAARKRKPSVTEDADSSKAKKSNNDSDKNVESANVMEVKDEQIMVKQDDEKHVERILSCSEEDYKNIDTELVEEMMEIVQKEMIPKYGDKYIVRFSPVELADLADETLQKLVIAQPNLAFYFKRQGKLKKKKGYAEVYLSQMQDARVFIQKLLQIKLIDDCIEVTLTVSKPKQVDEVLSLVISMSKNDKLLKLTKNVEDAKVLPGAKKEHFQVEKVPADANALMLRTLFPFAAEVIFSTAQKTSQSGYRGPVNVHYASSLWIDAVLDCCSNFTYNGYTLSVQNTVKKQETKPKLVTDVKKETSTVLKRKSSAQDKGKLALTKDDAIKAGSSSSGSLKIETAANESTSQDASLDEDISNMTLDVCTGMIESLNKLRQLGTDNPNIIKILQMQNELANLQQSLSLTRDQSQESSADDQADPWKVTADDLNDKQPEKDNGEKGQEKKPSTEQKRKQVKETKAEKQKKEMEDLQRMIEEADEAKRQREEKSKRQIEIEKQKIKELEERRKSNWARRMIDDAKQSAPLNSGENSTSKEEVQRILKIIGNKRKDAEEAKKLEEEAIAKDKESNSGPKKIGAEQATNNTLGSSELLKTSGLNQDTLQLDSKDTSNSRSDAEIPLDVTSAKQEPFHTQDTADTVTWSPDRAIHDGAPVYSEPEFSKMCSENASGVIPWDHFIQIEYYANRRCPVQLCPSSKYFKTASSFTLHWDVFHKPNVTVKFCQKCNAYFTNAPELESHLVKRHSISDPQIVKVMSEEAREKVVSNPSFRDPGKYLPPLV